MLEGVVVMVLRAGGVWDKDLCDKGCDGIKRYRRGYFSKKGALKDGDI